MSEKNKWSKAFARESSSKLIKENDFRSSQKQNSPARFSKTLKPFSHDATTDITNNYQSFTNQFNHDKTKGVSNFKNKYEQWKSEQDSMLKGCDDESRYERIKKYLNNNGDYIYKHDDIQSNLPKRGKIRQYTFNDQNKKSKNFDKYQNVGNFQGLKPFAAQDTPLSKTSINNHVRKYKPQETDISSEGNQHNIYGNNYDSNDRLSYKNEIQVYEDLENRHNMMRKAYSVDKYTKKYEINPYDILEKSPYIKLKSDKQDHSNCIYCKNHTAKKKKKVQKYFQPPVQQIIQQQPISYVQVIPQTRQILQPNIQHHFQHIPQTIPNYPLQYFIQPQHHHIPQQNIHPQQHYNQIVRPQKIIQPQQYYNQQIVQPQLYYPQPQQNYIQQITYPYNQQLQQHYIPQNSQQYVIQRPEYKFIPQFDNDIFVQPPVVIEQQPIENISVNPRISSSYKQLPVVSTPQYPVYNISNKQIKLSPTNLPDHTLPQHQFLVTPSIKLAKSKASKMSNKNLK